MNNSKFDDKERHSLKELAKALLLLPYSGAIVSSSRSSDYLRFLGFNRRKIVVGYNTLSLSRIIEQAGPPEASVDFNDRHFTVVARLVPKKNLFMILEAYAGYLAEAALPRALHLVGYGPLEKTLRETAESLGISKHVKFYGNLQSRDVSHVLSTSLALILMSTEEQFGNVVIEAQSLGVPVIISDVCGAWDNLVRSAVNGFVVEPDNVKGLQYYMSLIASRQPLWERLSSAALISAKLGDVQCFAEGVQKLLAKSQHLSAESK